ncbi:LysR family transcriptional regulator [Falsiroseomonas oryzae]|uniref:LysR family transcriptional regulator n=1 Tax=Falsiroseomonas oryzae TaxID=2766473 RepID=UPI0022EA8CA9|nr:LysR family transcriptional regulator [Roseomonas sp. MO-31]
MPSLATLRAIDLNLLVALDALLAERHVTRAAARIGLSQPAMSSALGRLRALFGDELLVRTRSGMEPTPRGLELAEATRHVLRQVARMMDSEAGFDPAVATQSFALRMSDLLGLLLLPGLAARLQRDAPGVTLEVRHLAPAATLEALQRDELDLAVSMGLEHGGEVRAMPVLADRMVCVLRAGHPASRRPLTLDGFLALRHLRVAMSPTDTRFVDDVLAAQGLRRQVALTVPHWLVVPEVLRAGDLVAVMSERLARAFAGAGSGLVLRDLPFASARFDWSLYWHRRHEGSRAHAWLRGVVAHTMAGLGQPRARRASSRRSSAEEPRLSARKMTPTRVSGSV